MKKYILLLLLIMCFQMNAQDWKTPTIEGYGKIVDYEKVAIKPDPKLEYKVLFAITTDEEREGVNVSLWKIARLINLLENDGVPKENIHIAAVISGSATNVTLSDKVYSKKMAKSNPNLELMEKLSDYGVQIHLCGQAAAAYKINPDTDLNPFTKLTLSAIIDIPTFSMQGYVVMF